MLVVNLQWHGTFLTVLLRVEELRCQLNINSDDIKRFQHFSLIICTRHRLHLKLLANRCHGLARVDNVKELLNGMLKLCQSKVALQLIGLDIWAKVA